MDRRIDLTANSDFRERRTILLTDNLSDQDMVAVHPDSLVYTGTKKDIELQRNTIRMFSGLFCDCCGKSLHVYPWEDLQGLCRTCEQEVRESVRGRFPWENKSLSNRGSNDPVIKEANAKRQKKGT